MTADPTTPAVLLAGLRAEGPVRRLLARHPGVVDAFWVTVFVLVQLVDLVVDAGPSSGRSIAADLVLLVAGIVLLLLRRSRPRLLLGVGLAGTVLLVVLSGGDTVLLVALALYTLAVQRGPRSAWRGFGWAAGVVVLLVALGSAGVVSLDGVLVEPSAADPSGPADWLPWGLLVLLVLVVATLVGTNVASRRRYLRDRAAGLERERDRQARLAVAEERGRIAREMHDVIAHSLAVTVALSDGASESRDPERARAASRQAAESGRAALAEMRRLLQVLDPDQTQHDRSPLPGLAQLPRLVEELRLAGLPVSARWETGLAVDPGVGLTVYRLVQESLTNALRHAAEPTAVEVSTTRVGDRLDVVVADDGHRAGGSGPAGRGLVGMRERVASVGGWFSAGPQQDGGWLVRASVPLSGPAGRTAAPVGSPRAGSPAAEDGSSGDRFALPRSPGTPG